MFYSVDERGIHLRRPISLRVIVDVFVRVDQRIHDDKRSLSDSYWRLRGRCRSEFVRTLETVLDTLENLKKGDFVDVVLLVIIIWIDNSSLLSYLLNFFPSFIPDSIFLFHLSILPSPLLLSFSPFFLSYSISFYFYSCCRD